MSDHVYLPTKRVRLGERLDYRVRAFNRETNASLATAIAQIAIYDSAGTATLAVTSMTISGTKRIIASYRITTGTGQTITAAGTYRVIVRFTFGSGATAQVYELQGNLEVLANPT